MDELIAERFAVMEQRAQLTKQKKLLARRQAKEAELQRQAEGDARQQRMSEYTLKVHKQAHKANKKKQFNFKRNPVTGPPKNGAGLRIFKPQAEEEGKRVVQESDKAL